VKWIVKNWLDISFWICTVCFFINVILIEFDLAHGFVDAAHMQMAVAGICAVGAFIQYLRALPAEPKDEDE
jgi:hypothetical protein